MVFNKNIYKVEAYLELGMNRNQNLFSKMMNAKNVDEIYSVFSKVKASEYWNNHFSFGKISPVESQKYLTKDFIDLVILNAVLPFK